MFLGLSFVCNEEPNHKQETPERERERERDETKSQHESYSQDDLYCYVNGWYSFKNRAQVVNNFTYLEEISDTWCTHLANIVPGGLIL